MINHKFNVISGNADKDKKSTENHVGKVPGEFNQYFPFNLYNKNEAENHYQLIGQSSISEFSTQKLKRDILKGNKSSLSEGGLNMENTNAFLRQELRDDMRADRKEFKDEIREQKQIFDNQLNAYKEDAQAREERIEGKFNSVMDEMRSQRSDANSRFNVLDGKVDSVRTELIGEFKSSKRWIIGTIVGAFVGFLGVIATILTIFF